MRKKERFPRFSNDHNENIEMQNSFLLMKIMLESDVNICSSYPQTPEMRNSFLKFVIKNKLHLSFCNKVADLLGNPDFTDEKELGEEKFRQEYTRLKNLLYSHSMKVKFDRKLSDRDKYKFIIQELFAYETDQNPELPMRFSYEFFHNDFKSELKEATEFFMRDFFEKDLQLDSNYGLHLFVPPDESQLTQEEFVNRVDSVYQIFYKITDYSFVIDKITTDTKLVKSNFEGNGFCEGNVAYSVSYMDGEKRSITGRFKIYFSLQYIGFLVNYYEIAGLNYLSDSSEVIT